MDAAANWMFILALIALLNACFAMGGRFLHPQMLAEYLLDPAKGVPMYSPSAALQFGIVSLSAATVASILKAVSAYLNVRLRRGL